MESVICWFRQDLRLTDNPAWNRALASGGGIIPLYCHAPGEAGGWAPGGASSWWLHHALADLDAQLRQLGLRLVLRQGGSSQELLESVLRESGARAVFWNRCYEPWRRRIDGEIKERLRASGREAWSGNSSLLREPWEVSTKQGRPYKVFTPYSRACAEQPEREPETTEAQPPGPTKWPQSDSLSSLGLLPRVRWDAGFTRVWDPTRRGAWNRLQGFLGEGLDGYADSRNFPAIDGTSRLSPYLHWGQLGPREVAASLRRRRRGGGRDTYHRELVWREFAYHVLYHFPDTPEEPLQRKFRAFPWSGDRRTLEAWQAGRTGYPMVDAGMRELWETGWMHNRVRMVVASFLVKHLLHSWEAGARWFWDTLVDADLASNTLGWQWAGGCGADAAPYFRIFNPITQGEKFDPEGSYIRRFVPELVAVPDRFLHAPWKMPLEVQRQAGCRIGTDYPEPVVDHGEGRQRALEALETIKEAAS